jgi:ABC-type multidrug transport system fused ATPase/permease subunit
MMSTLTRYSNSFMTVLMLVIFTGMVIIASRYPAGARFMPFVLGFPAIALCLLQLFLDARERHLAKAKAKSEVELAQEQVSRAVGHAVHFDVTDTMMPEEGLDPREHLRREGIAWAYFLGLIAGIILFGFHISVPLFLVLFLRYRAKASWKMTLGLTVVASFILFFAFERLLHIPLHTGFITDSVMDMIGIGD